MGTGDDQDNHNENAEALKFRLELETCIVAISTNLIHVLPEQIERKIYQSLEAIGRFVGAESCYMLLFAGQGTDVEQLHEWSSLDESSPYDGHVPLPIVLEDWFVQKQSFSQSSSLGLETDSSQTFLLLPVEYEKTVIGFLGFDHILPTRRWSSEDQAMLKVVGGILVTALKHHHAETERKQNERKAYVAGMAENAISVLHNIGNAITPTIVNIVHMMEINKKDLQASYLQKLESTFSEHLEKGNLQTFLTEDPKGKQMLSFVKMMAETQTHQQQENAQLLKVLNHQLRHIADIITLQQKYAHFEAHLEECNVAVVIQDALEMMQSKLEKRQIQLNRTLEDDLPLLVCDKNKLIQVLLNLIKNAIESIEANPDDTKQGKIEIECRKEAQTFIQFSVKDNGSGAEPETIKRLFEFGFSTKKRSSGFGLHDFANFVQKQNGTFHFSSLGPNQGATVQFSLPLAIDEKP